MKRLLALVIVAVIGSSCAFPPFSSTSPSSSDSIAYEVAGANVTGIAQIVMATPTGQSTSPAPAGPTFVFVSPVIAGYGQFNDIKPNVTVVGYGCFDTYVIVNAQKTRQAHDCGQPITVSSK
jgi:hypothetical protein